MMIRYLVCPFALTAVLLFTVHGAGQATAGEPPAVIFDTDMGSDCDDAGALAILNALADAGEVRILGVVFSSGRNPIRGRHV